MKITKRQLRRIIREEKAKSINESRQGERALGIYADMSEEAALKKQIHSFIENVWAAAEADGVDEDEAGAAQVSVVYPGADDDKLTLAAPHNYNLTFVATSTTNYLVTGWHVGDTPAVFGDQ